MAGTEVIHHKVTMVDVKPVELMNPWKDQRFLNFSPTLRSGSSVNTGARKDTKDEHIRIDDPSSFLGSVFLCPSPTAFYWVFDGHGGLDAASYI